MTTVLIVGAGPSGLTAANVLARYGVDFRIIDTNSQPTNQSRALLVHVRTLELWDKLGLASQAVSDGLKITDICIRDRGKHLANLPLTNEQHEQETPFPYALAYPQNETERLLIGGLQEYGCYVEWEVELLTLSQTETEVEAIVRRSNGQEEAIRTRWLIGADGASSTVRNLLDLPFEGDTYETTAFLADVEMETAVEPNQVNLNLAQGGFVGIVPLYGGTRFRLFGALSAAFAEKVKVNDGKDVRLEDLQQWFDEYFFLDTKLTNVYWTSLYRIHRRMSDQFRRDRCFLIGDAAHIHSPAGGQGMNLAIGDGFNLAWKLAFVVKGEADSALLESYEAERIQVARQVLHRTDQGFELEATQNQFLEWFKVHVFPLILRVATNFDAVQNQIFELFSQTWICYSDSPVVEDAASIEQSPKVGDRAPYGLFVDGDHQSQSLFERIRGVDHHLLLFEGRKSTMDFPVIQKTLQTLLDRYRFKSHVIAISHVNRSLHSRYGASTPRLVFLRPDGHIGFQSYTGQLDAFERYLDRLYIHK